MAIMTKQMVPPPNPFEVYGDPQPPTSVLTGARVTGGNGGVSSVPIGTPMPKPVVNFGTPVPKPQVSFGTPVPKLPPPTNFGAQGAIMSGTAPVSVQPLNTSSMITGVPITGGNAPVSSTPVIGAGAAVPPAPPQAAGDVTMGFLEQFLNSDNAYMQNARRSGIEAAAQRGLTNSTIAGGNSQRAAIEAVQPFVAQAGQLYGQREQNTFEGQQNSLNRDLTRSESALGRAHEAAENALGRALTASESALLREFTGGQNNLNREHELRSQREQLAFTGEQNQRDRNQQITMAEINEWAANNEFTRQYNATLSMIPITSTQQLNTMLMQAAIDNPEVFPPEIVSGLTEFFGNNLLSSLAAWFPNTYGAGANGSATPPTNGGG